MQSETTTPPVYKSGGGLTRNPNAAIPYMLSPELSSRNSYKGGATMKRRCLSFLLALCMLLTFLPASALADENPAADADMAPPETADDSATQESAENSDLASKIAFPSDDANAAAFQAIDASAEENGAETTISVAPNPDAQIPEHAELMAANVTYANYSGVNYANVGLSSERVATLNKAMRMVTIQWTAIESFRTWCSSAGSYNTAVAIDGTSSTYFQAGKTYTGIPYSMANHTFDDIGWKNYVESGSITKSNMSATYYSHGKETTARGIDCSYFVYLAIREAVGPSNISYQTTATMLNSTTYYEKLTGISDMIPGDLFLTNGHVMMYVGRSGSKYAVFEADADDSKCSYNEYDSSSLSSYGCYRYKGFDTESIVNTFERDTRYPVPITAYPAQTSGKVTVYDNSLNAYSTSSRWIDYNDQCSITDIYTNGFCRVTYPTSSGSTNAYAKWSSFNPNAATPYLWSPSSNVTSYKKSNMSEKIGEVYTTDSCTVVGASGNTLQVIYPVSGGYKLGWVENSSPPTPVPVPVPDPVPTDDVLLDPIIYNSGYYFAANYDVQLQCGNDAAALQNHWLTEGISRSLPSSQCFNAGYYKNQYPEDLGNMSTEELARHFIQHGLWEGRVASEHFNIGAYKANYGDLQDAFGENLYEYAKHYIYPGWDEEQRGERVANRRIVVRFDAAGGSCATAEQPFTYRCAYGNLPAPTKAGYAFAGWYTGDGTPVSSETVATFKTDHTLYAHWTPVEQTFSLDLNGVLHGSSEILPSFDNYGRADVYINGQLIWEQCGDCWQAVHTGDTYEIKNITAQPGYIFEGVTSGTLSGTIGTEHVLVTLSFKAIESYCLDLNGVLHGSSLRSGS